LTGASGSSARWNAVQALRRNCGVGFGIDGRFVPREGSGAGAPFLIFKL
jgi:hypothetical protein